MIAARASARTASRRCSIRRTSRVRDSLHAKTAHLNPPVTCAARPELARDDAANTGPWCPNEDAQLVELVKQYGGKHWARIASMLPGRTGKQCRERWCNNLDPSLKKGAWSPEVRARPHTSLPPPPLRVPVAPRYLLS